MIHCEKTEAGIQILVKGTGSDIVKESLRIIQAVYWNIQNSDPEFSEAYKKIVVSSVLGLDGFSVFNEPQNATHVDYSYLHRQNRNGDDD